VNIFNGFGISPQKFGEFSHPDCQIILEVFCKKRFQICYLIWLLQMNDEMRMQERKQ
jgi:hypothetical protein